MEVKADRRIQQADSGMVLSLSRGFARPAGPAACRSLLSSSHFSAARAAAAATTSSATTVSSGYCASVSQKVLALYGPSVLCVLCRIVLHGAEHYSEVIIDIVYWCLEWVARDRCTVERGTCAFAQCRVGAVSAARFL